MPTVVVLGFGIAGSKAAAALAKTPGLEVKIITAQQYSEVTFAATHFTARPEKYTGFLAADMPRLAAMAPGAEFIIGVATRIENNKVVLDSGREVEFDGLVVSVGFSMPALVPAPGMALKNRQDQILAVNAAVVRAKSILVAGGGSVAVELAGDLREITEAQITLLVRGDTILRSTEAGLRKRVVQKLKDLRIEVMYNSSLKEEGGQDVVLTPADYTINTQGASKSIQADVFLSAFAKPHAHFMPASALDPSGKIIVNEYLQTTSMPNVFAMGWCSSHPGTAGAKSIMDQTGVVTSNIKALLLDKGGSMKAAPVSTTGPPWVKAGHDTWSAIDAAAVPFPAKLLGFPFCPFAPCCFCIPCGCSPFFCGYCCGHPEGKGTAQTLKCLLTVFAKHNMKGLGSAGKPAKIVPMAMER